MDGAARKNRATEDAARSGHEQPVIKLSRRWCAACCSVPGDACGAHPIVDSKQAEAELGATFAVQQEVMKLMEVRLAKLQAERRRRVAVVLEAEASSEDPEHNHGWSITGGEISFTVDVRDADRVAALCQALEGMELEYDDDEDSTAHGLLLAMPAMKNVFKHLPKRVVGQTLPLNTILMSPWAGCQYRLDFHCDGVVRPHQGPGAKVLGCVSENPGSLDGEGCTADRYDWDGCPYNDRDCYCITKTPGTAKLSNVHVISE